MIFKFARQIAILLVATLLAFSSAWAGEKKLPRKLPPRLPASFVEGLKNVKKTCKAYSAPQQGANVLFEIKEGRKIWLTGYDRFWYIAYTKKRKKVYVHADCF